MKHLKHYIHMPIQIALIGSSATGHAAHALTLPSGRILSPLYSDGFNASFSGKCIRHCVFNSTWMEGERK